MSPEILQFLLKLIESGRTVTIGVSTPHKYKQIRQEFKDLGFKPFDKVTIVYTGSLAGAACLHTDVLCLVDIASANKRAIKEIRCVLVNNPDGRTPIVIEC